VKHIETLTICLVFLLTGCATPTSSTFDYKESQPIPVANEIIVDRPFEDVWDTLIGNLAKSFFVVNNIEKESRLINVDFGTDMPEEYVECGTATRTFKSKEDEVTFSYPVAADSSYLRGEGNATPHYWVGAVDRHTDLQGKTNVYVAPEGSNTRVSVNSRYVLSVKTTGQAKFINGLFGTVQGSRIIEPTSAKVSFNTNLPGTSDGVLCYSKGVLEKQILDMIDVSDR
jgi:hypothetical protein